MITKSLILFPGMILILTGCVTLYKPNTVNSPMLKEKGELNTSASLGLTGCGSYNLQAAYALNNHTGIMINGMYHYRDLSSGSPDEKLKISSLEAGAGYFSPFGNQKSGLFQLYGGAGYGSTRDEIINSDQSNPEVSAKYFNIFFQPGAAYTKKDFGIAFDLRANYVHLFNIHAYLFEEFEFWNTDFKYHSDTTLHFVNLEPAVTMKIGGEKWKGVIQMGLIIPAINSRSYFHVNSSSFLLGDLFKFSVGVNYSFKKK